MAWYDNDPAIIEQAASVATPRPVTTITVRPQLAAAGAAVDRMPTPAFQRDPTLATQPRSFSMDQFPELEAQNGVMPGLLKRVYGAETNYGKDLSTSKAGAMGHFQFMPGTAQQYGVADPMSLEQSAKGAAHYLKDLYGQFGDWQQATAAYNWGPANVARVVKEHGDKWRDWLPAETQQYLGKTFDDYTPRSGPIPSWTGKDYGNDKVKFSEYAMNQYRNKPETAVVWMSPRDYLDLTPDMRDPASDKAGRSLRVSLAKGEAVEQIPSLTMAGGKVTDQDGRHRALAAQEAGLDMIPVAINGMGWQKPTEVVGMTGNVLPFDFQKVEAKPAQEAKAAPAWYDADPPVEHDNMLVSGIKGVGEGAGEAVLGAGQLLGEGVKAIASPNAGLPIPESHIDRAMGMAGGWIANKAEQGVEALRGWIAPDEAAHPWATGAGELIGQALPTIPLSALGGARMAAAGMGAGGRIVGAAGAGAAGALTQPVTSGEYWGEKGKQAAVGAAAGAVLGTAGNALASATAPKMRDAAAMLMREGVNMTPGQLAGGVAKVVEDKAMSVPITGDVISHILKSI